MPMAYIKTEWQARQAINPNKYTKSDETADSVVLINTPDSITVQGTLFTPDNMNHIEEGIFQAHNGIAAESQARQQADTTLQNNINAEAQARAAAINAESQARQQGDSNLAQAIANEIQGRQSAINAEAQARQQDIAALHYYIAELIRLMESGLGPIPRFPWVTDDGYYIVTDTGDYIVVA